MTYLPRALKFGTSDSDVHVCQLNMGTCKSYVHSSLAYPFELLHPGAGPATGMHLPTKDVAAWKPRTFSRPDMTGASRSGCPGQMEDLIEAVEAVLSDTRWREVGSTFASQLKTSVWCKNRGRRGSRIVEPKGFSFGTSGKRLEIKRNQCLKAKYLHDLLAATIILPLWYPLMPFFGPSSLDPPAYKVPLTIAAAAEKHWGWDQRMKNQRLKQVEAQPRSCWNDGELWEPETTGEVGFSYSLPFCNLT